MSLKEIIGYFSIILFASAIVWAEETTTQLADGSDPSEGLEPGYGDPGNNSSDVSPTPRPGFGHHEHQGPPHNMHPRHKRSAEHNKTHNEHHQVRAAHRRTSCNNAGRGSMCRNCHEVLECLPGNRSTVRKCTGSLRFCNNGRCSSRPGARCHRPIRPTSSPRTSSSTAYTTSGDADSDSTTSTSTTTSSTSTSIGSTTSTTDSATSTTDSTTSATDSTTSSTDGTSTSSSSSSSSTTSASTTTEEDSSE